MRLSSRLIGLLLALLMPSVLAQEPAEHLETEHLETEHLETEHLETESEQAEAMAAEARARVQQILLDTAAALESQLADMSLQTGPYDVGLAEVQEDLGRTYLELGEPAQAAAALEQGLQLLRINHGLYDESQIPMLEKLVVAQRAQGEWDKVDDYQHLVFSLQRRNYEPDSVEFADAVLAMGDWQLTASNANVLGRPGSLQRVEELNALKALYGDVRQHAEARGDLSRQWELMYATALTDVEIARQFLMSGSDLMISAPRYVTQTVCRTVADANGVYQRICWQESVNNPAYYRQLRDERRTQLDRARRSLQLAQQEMQTLLDANPQFAADNQSLTQTRMNNLSQVVTDLQREARRATLSSWF